MIGRTGIVAHKLSLANRNEANEIIQVRDTENDNDFDARPRKGTFSRPLGHRLFLRGKSNSHSTLRYAFDETGSASRVEEWKTQKTEISERRRASNTCRDSNVRPWRINGTRSVRDREVRPIKRIVRRDQSCSANRTAAVDWDIVCSRFYGFWRHREAIHYTPVILSNARGSM